MLKKGIEKVQSLHNGKSTEIAIGLKVNDKAKA